MGRAGRFLDRALEAAGLSRREVFITSVEKHFPPRNRMPTRAEIDACKPWLLEQLARVDPEVMVLLGRVAEAAVARDAVLKGRRVLVTVHPAAAMRFPRLRRRLHRDLGTLKRWCETPVRRALRRPDSQRFRGRLRGSAAFGASGARD